MKLEKRVIRLMGEPITEEEISAALDPLRKGRYTQGEVVEEFENKFSEWNGSEYSVMVNSGSSANLALIDLVKEKHNLKEGDEILVPNVTWFTTVYPVIQSGLKPVFCDVDESYNISLGSMEKMLGDKTRGVFAVHLLGQTANMKDIKKFCDEKNLILMEDCCEGQGSKFNGKRVGNLGEGGTFSFYVGHIMTTIEGGMITTNDENDYNMLKSIRNHGLTRRTNRESFYPEFKDKKYVSDVMGYNFRNTNVHAAIGLVQLKKVDSFIKKRVENHEYFLEKIKNLPLTPQKVNLKETSSFSLGFLFPDKDSKEYILERIMEEGVESRSIVAGNLLRQPVFRGKEYKSDLATMANEIHDRGIYLPNHQEIEKEDIDYMVDLIKYLGKY